MAFSTSGPGQSSMAEINMTPMIDVLLVLLVIFMIAQPLLQKSIDVQLPADRSESTAPATQIVLEIDAEGAYRINSRPVDHGHLLAALHEIYRDRPDKVLFIQADGELSYQSVIEAMDVARGAGVKVLGTVLPSR